VSQVLIETRQTDQGGRVAILTLNDPERRNALTLDMVGEISAAFEDFESDDSGVGAVVVTGAGRAFCAGANLASLGEQGQADRAQREAGMRAIYEGFLRVARCSLPTLAAVNGPAVGAGLNLALCCDLRIAARSARFDSRFLQLGLHPGGGHMWMLQRAVGPQVAAAMVLFDTVLDCDEAVRHGLALSATDDDALLDEAIRWAARVAANPRDLVRRAKQELMLPAGDHAAAVGREIDAQVWSLSQPFFADRLAQLQSRIAGKSKK
jgi:enoyl-CoA hydratase